LESLIEATEHLNSTFDLEELLSIILDLSLKNLSAERGTIYLIDEEKNELWSHILRGNEMSEIRLPLGTGIAGTVAAEGKTILLNDAASDTRFFSGYDKKSGFVTKTMLCHPMKNRDGKIMGVFQILNKKRGTFNEDDIRFLEAFSDHVVLAVENAKLVQASLEQERIQRDLQIAAAIQQRIIPKQLPAIPGYDLASVALPSKMVGGDFFDIILLENGTYAIIMADVSGKGIPASLIVSNLHASLRAHIQYEQNLVKLVTKLNAVVCDTTTPESFITVFILILDPASHTFTYINAGHNAPYVLDGDARRDQGTPPWRSPPWTDGRCSV
jgi:sigma-B regulation protein RsbU (phosphoserine phosphatase)